MSTTLTTVLKTVIALALAGSLVVQTMIAPTIWFDTAGDPLWARIVIVSIIVLGVGTMEVFAVCVWRLLTLVRRGAVFSTRAFRYVDVIIGAIAAAALLTFVLAALLAPGDAAPGLVGLIGGGGLVLVGMALLVVVMRTLLAQAIARDHEARSLRDELDEVI